MVMSRKHCYKEHFFPYLGEFVLANISFVHYATPEIALNCIPLLSNHTSFLTEVQYVIKIDSSTIDYFTKWLFLVSFIMGLKC